MIKAILLSLILVFAAAPARPVRPTQPPQPIGPGGGCTIVDGETVCTVPEADGGFRTKPGR